MTSTPDNPLGMRLEAAFDLVGKRFSRLTALTEEDVSPEVERPAVNPTANDSVIETGPVNPLRHWRWE